MNSKVTYYMILMVVLVVSIGASIIYPMMNFGVSTTANQDEPFFSPGHYPVAVDKPLLYNSYNVKENTGVSDYTSEDIMSDYPVFPASSCQNNNIRYWRRPNNGTCSPADFCGGIYKTTEPNIPEPLQPPPKDCGVRVNYFDSSTY